MSRWRTPTRQLDAASRPAGVAPSVGFDCQRTLPATATGYSPDASPMTIGVTLRATVVRCGGLLADSCAPICRSPSLGSAHRFAARRPSGMRTDLPLAVLWGCAPICRSPTERVRSKLHFMRSARTALPQALVFIATHTMLAGPEALPAWSALECGRLLAVNDSDVIDADGLGEWGDGREVVPRAHRLRLVARTDRSRHRAAGCECG